MISLFGPPDPTLLEASYSTLWSSKHQGDGGLRVVDVKSICSVVAMIPHKPIIPGKVAEDRFFICEKPGLDIGYMGGVEEQLNEE